MLDATLTRFMNLSDEQLQRAQANLIPKTEIKHLSMITNSGFLVQTVVGVQINEQKKVEHLILTVDRTYSKESERYSGYLRPVKCFLLIYVPIGLVTRFVRGALLLNNAQCERGRHHDNVKGIYMQPDTTDYSRVITNLVFTQDGDLFFPYGVAIYGPYATEIVSHEMKSAAQSGIVVYTGQANRGLMSVSATDLYAPIMAYDILTTRRRMANQPRLGCTSDRVHASEDYATEYYHFSDDATLEDRLFVGDRYGSRDSNNVATSAGSLFNYLSRSHILAGTITSNVVGILPFLSNMRLLPTAESINLYNCTAEKIVLPPIWAATEAPMGYRSFTVQLSRCKIGEIAYMAGSDGLQFKPLPYSLSIHECEIDRLCNVTEFRTIYTSKTTINSVHGMLDKRKSFSYRS